VNGKKCKALRRMVTGDPDMAGRVFARLERDKTGEVHLNDTTHRLHPTSVRAQYQMAKKEVAR
jgi:hypothetical protein